MNRSLYLSLILCSSVFGCGGGGGSSDPTYSGSADVSIQATPSKIDTGDRTEVSIEVSNVNANGIALKIRYPNGLQYVPSSAKLLTEEKEADLTPTVNVAAPGEPQMYLVFFLKQRSFRPTGQQYTGQSGTVALQFVGLGAVDGGTIEVDADVDDHSVDNTVEFNVNQPQFVPASSAKITVVTQ